MLIVALFFISFFCIYNKKIYLCSVIKKETIT
nr:MAG TPA: hypothetical protein [Caudoviricetes sp.]